MKTFLPREIENICEWEILEKALITQGCTLFQFQYDVKQSEGFHAWFLNKTKNVEIITHNLEVQVGIVKYNSKQH